MLWKMKVKVTFVEADSGRTVAETSVPPEQLPESFEADTTVTLQDQPWEVLKAEPVTRAEYVRSRALRLTVRRLNLASMPPGELLYSLPTICDAIPAVEAGTSKLGKNVLELHEDDWRQVELIASVNRAEAQDCLKKIRGIFETQRASSVGFRSVHVRTEVAAPLRGSQLTSDALRSTFASARELDGLGYQGVAGLIGGGFALEATGVTVFGLARGENVEVCCFHFRPEPTLPDEAEALSSLMAATNTLLVDWCRAAEVEADPAALKRYFGAT